MFCHKCGANNRIEASFCKKCGAKLVKPVLDSEEKLTPHKVVVTTTVKKEEQIKKSENLSLTKKSPLKYYFSAAIIVAILLIVLSPEAKAYYGYYKGTKLASKAFAENNYSDAVKDLQQINQHGLYKTFKSSLNQTLVRYIQIKNEDADFQQATQDEHSGDLDNAKKLLESISDKVDYPKIGQVTSELNKVDDAVTAKVQADAAAKVAIAQQQAQQAAAQAKAEVANRKKAEQEAAQAASNAAANQAAAEAAQQQAAQQEAEAEAAQQQAQQEEQVAQQAQAIAEQQNQAAESNYITTFVTAETLENTANSEINDGVSAFVSGNYTLALDDLDQSQTDSYDAEHELPATQPTIFQNVNNDLINASNYCNLAAREFYNSIEDLNSALGDQAFVDQKTGISYYSQIQTDFASIGY